MADTSDFLAQARGELKKRALAEGLMVDSSATYALESLLGKAFAEVQQAEGPGPFTPSRRIEFDRTAECLAEEAAKAARQDNAPVIGSEHVDSAAAQLRSWKFWPFTGD